MLLVCNGEKMRGERGEGRGERGEGRGEREEGRGKRGVGGVGGEKET